MKAGVFYSKNDLRVEEIRYFIDAVRNDKKIETASPESVSETMKIEDMLLFRRTSWR